MHIDWVTLIVVTLNAIVSFLTNRDVNIKRNQSREED
ncbi:MAG: hypothetical protein [Arizlama microvirus]|nr:MAG: hypothetical protein [Arizlama microvirus]